MATEEIDREQEDEKQIEQSRSFMESVGAVSRGDKEWFAERVQQAEREQEDEEEERRGATDLEKRLLKHKRGEDFTEYEDVEREEFVSEFEQTKEDVLPYQPLSSEDPSEMTEEERANWAEMQEEYDINQMGKLKDLSNNELNKLFGQKDQLPQEVSDAVGREKAVRYMMEGYKNPESLDKAIERDMLMVREKSDPFGFLEWFSEKVGNLMEKDYDLVLEKNDIAREAAMRALYDEHTLRYHLLNAGATVPKASAEFMAASSAMSGAGSAISKAPWIGKKGKVIRDIWRGMGREAKNSVVKYAADALRGATRTGGIFATREAMQLKDRTPGETVEDSLQSGSWGLVIGPLSAIPQSSWMGKVAKESAYIGVPSMLSGFLAATNDEEQMFDTKAAIGTGITMAGFRVFSAMQQLPRKIAISRAKKALKTRAKEMGYDPTKVKDSVWGKYAKRFYNVDRTSKRHLSSVRKRWGEGVTQKVSSNMAKMAQAQARINLANQKGARPPQDAFRQVRSAQTALREVKPVSNYLDLTAKLNRVNQRVKSHERKGETVPSELRNQQQNLQSQLQSNQYMKDIQKGMKITKHSSSVMRNFVNDIGKTYVDAASSAAKSHAREGGKKAAQSMLPMSSLEGKAEAKGALQEGAQATPQPPATTDQRETAPAETPDGAAETEVETVTPEEQEEIESAKEELQDEDTEVLKELYTVTTDDSPADLTREQLIDAIAQEESGDVDAGDVDAIALDYALPEDFPESWEGHLDKAHDIGFNNPDIELDRGKVEESLQRDLSDQEWKEYSNSFQEGQDEYHKIKKQDVNGKPKAEIAETMEAYISAEEVEWKGKSVADMKYKERMDMARRLDIKGRSKMNKKKLGEAITATLELFPEKMELLDTLEQDIEESPSLQEAIKARGLEDDITVPWGDRDISDLSKSELKSIAQRQRIDEVVNQDVSVSKGRLRELVLGETLQKVNDQIEQQGLPEIESQEYDVMFGKVRKPNLKEALQGLEQTVRGELPREEQLSVVGIGEKKESQLPYQGTPNHRELGRDLYQLPGNYADEWYSNGVVMVKGDVPLKRPGSEQESDLTEQDVDEMLEADTVPATLDVYTLEDWDAIEASHSPITDPRSANAGSDNAPMAWFEAEGGYYAFDQGRVNLIREQHGNVGWGINTDTGQLLAYGSQGDPVALLSPFDVHRVSREDAPPIPPRDAPVDLERGILELPEYWDIDSPAPAESSQDLDVQGVKDVANLYAPSLDTDMFDADTLREVVETFDRRTGFARDYLTIIEEVDSVDDLNEGDDVVPVPLEPDYSGTEHIPTYWAEQTANAIKNRAIGTVIGFEEGGDSGPDAVVVRWGGGVEETHPIYGLRRVKEGILSEEQREAGPFGNPAEGKNQVPDWKNKNPSVAQTRAIHAITNGLDEETRRDMMEEVTGERSVSDMNRGQASKLITELKKRSKDIQQQAEENEERPQPDAGDEVSEEELPETTTNGKAAVPKEQLDQLAAMKENYADKVWNRVVGEDFNPLDTSEDNIISKEQADQINHDLMVEQLVWEEHEGVIEKLDDVDVDTADRLRDTLEYLTEGDDWEPSTRTTNIRPMRDVFQEHLSKADPRLGTLYRIISRRGLDTAINAQKSALQNVIDKVGNFGLMTIQNSKASRERIVQGIIGEDPPLKQSERDVVDVIQNVFRSSLNKLHLSRIQILAMNSDMDPGDLIGNYEDHKETIDKWVDLFRRVGIKEGRRQFQEYVSEHGPMAWGKVEDYMPRRAKHSEEADWMLSILMPGRGAKKGTPVSRHLKKRILEEEEEMPDHPISRMLSYVSAVTKMAEITPYTHAYEKIVSEVISRVEDKNKRQSLERMLLDDWLTSIYFGRNMDMGFVMKNLNRFKNWAKKASVGINPWLLIRNPMQSFAHGADLYALEGPWMASDKAGLSKDYSTTERQEAYFYTNVDRLNVVMRYLGAEEEAELTDTMDGVIGMGRDMFLFGLKTLMVYPYTDRISRKQAYGLMTHRLNRLADKYDSSREFWKEVSLLGWVHEGVLQQAMLIYGAGDMEDAIAYLAGRYATYTNWDYRLAARPISHQQPPASVLTDLMLWAFERANMHYKTIRNAFSPGAEGDPSSRARGRFKAFLKMLGIAFGGGLVGQVLMGLTGRRRNPYASSVSLMSWTVGGLQTGGWNAVAEMIWQLGGIMRGEPRAAYRFAKSLSRASETTIPLYAEVIALLDNINGVRGSDSYYFQAAIAKAAREVDYLASKLSDDYPGEESINQMIEDMPNKKNYLEDRRFIDMVYRMFGRGADSLDESQKSAGHKVVDELYREWMKSKIGEATVPQYDYLRSLDTGDRGEEWKERDVKEFYQKMREEETHKKLPE